MAATMTWSERKAWYHEHREAVRVLPDPRTSTGWLANAAEYGNEHAHRPPGSMWLRAADGSIRDILVMRLIDPPLVTP